MLLFGVELVVVVTLLDFIASFASSGDFGFPKIPNGVLFGFRVSLSILVNLLGIFSLKLSLVAPVLANALSLDIK